MQYTIEVTVDTCSSDFVTEVTDITEEKLKKLRPLIQAVKEFEPYEVRLDWNSKERWYSHGHNFPYGSMIREDLNEKLPEEIYGWSEDEIEELYDVLPHTNAFHSITSVKVYPRTEKEVLL